MGLGPKSAEELCSIIIDPKYYISHLELNRNPLGDEGIIVLMHGIKRSKSIIKLNLSSTNITAIGAKRIFRALRNNESLIEFILSNEEIHKNQFGFKAL